MFSKAVWRCFLIIALLVYPAIGYSVDGSRLSALAAPTDPIILPVPALTPPTIDLCNSYWYTLANAYQTYPAYLTQNAATVTQSSNSGEWRPNLAASAFYKVEVYIPAHAPIVWNCTSQKTINQDTSTARYTVLSSSQPVTITVDQAANAGLWVNLGTYYFTAGTSGAVQLTDLTSGPAFVKTVSFSAARFTPAPTASRLILPVLASNFYESSGISLTSLQLAGRGNQIRTRFDAFEPIVYTLNGHNSNSTPAQVDVSWSLAGPCGSGSLGKSAVQLGSGSWTQTLTTTIPACTGVYTVTAQVLDRGAVSSTLNAKSQVFQVDAGGKVQIFADHLFDMCNLPSIGDMQQWWKSSPYKGVGVYIGGSAFARGCNFVSSITRTWVKEVQKAGWTFLPIWVGPQAPCFTRDIPKMSADPATANLQGRQEAQAAFTKLFNLGLTEAITLTSIIYYDVEAFPSSDLTCSATVSKFIDGWTEELHLLKMKAGAYSVPSTANYGNWATLTNAPDAVWMATYIQASFTPTITVSDIPILSGSLWTNHQRVFQYAGGHNETWGGVKLNIDSNVADAPLLVSLWPTATKDILPGAGQSETPVISYGHISEFQQVDSQQGWVMVDGRMIWTVDNGQSWQERALPPALRAGLQFEKAFYLPSGEGWILARSQTGLVLLHTKNNLDWEITTLPDTDIASPQLLSFDQQGNGLITFRQAGLVNQAQELALSTGNLGATWQENLQAAPTLQASGARGPAWLLDFGGGQTWEAFLGIPIPANLVNPKVMNLPDGAVSVSLISRSQAWASTFQGQCFGTKGQTGFYCTVQTALWATTDGGQTWRLLVK